MALESKDLLFLLFLSYFLLLISLFVQFCNNPSCCLKSKMKPFGDNPCYSVTVGGSKCGERGQIPTIDVAPFSICPMFPRTCCHSLKVTLKKYIP